MKPTRIALITDSHGNLPALRAALAAIETENCDSIYHLGDAIAIGPFSAECLDLMLAAPHLTCILGNHELYYLQGIPGPKLARMSAGEVQHQKWVHRQLGEGRKLPLANWKMGFDCEIEGLKVHFQHYGFAKNGESFARIIREPTAIDLDNLFAGVDADVIFYGHAHQGGVGKSTRLYLNPGSLGCNPKAVAQYTIAEFMNGKVTFEHRETPYDDGELFAAFEERNVPDRQFINDTFFAGRFKAYETSPRLL
jgi:putative phosphoesterase